jgi:hypothetical protein
MIFVSNVLSVLTFSTSPPVDLFGMSAKMWRGLPSPIGRRPPPSDAIRNAAFGPPLTVEVHRGRTTGVQGDYQSRPLAVLTSSVVRGLTGTMLSHLAPPRVSTSSPDSLFLASLFRLSFKPSVLSVLLCLVPVFPSFFFCLVFRLVVSRSVSKRGLTRHKTEQDRQDRTF